MKLKLYTILFSGISLTFFSCKTASKLYEKGNYDEAVELAAKKLQKDPDDPKLLNILQNAYRYALNDHENRIHSYSESNNELKWEWIYGEYASMQKLYEAIFRSPEVFRIVNPSDYSSYLVTYREKAGDVRYERGIAFMQQDDKQSYRNAYREFQAALRFEPGNRDAILRMNEAFDYAVTNVVVLPVQQQGGYVYSSYNVGGNNFDDQLIRNLQYNGGSGFVKFYSAWDARSRQFRVDQELSMQFASIDIGRYHDDRSTRKVSKEVVVKETVYKPDSIVKEYTKVFASITTTSRIMRSEAVLQVTVRNENGHRVWSDSYGAAHNWSTRFATFTGDERALSDSDKQLINRRREFAPSENEIMKCMLDEISNNALYSIKNYFNRY